MGEPLTLLYVEDNDANYTLCARVLQTTGLYLVERAETAEAALEWIKNRLPALFLLDLDLPGMNGIELAQRLRADPISAGVPIVVVSASVMQRERRRALEAGANAFVEKPFDIAELRVTVATVLAHHSPAKAPDTGPTAT